VSTYLVYKAISPSGKVYIGLTSKSLKERIRAHLSNAKWVTHRANRFRHAVRKYGQALVWEILGEGLSSEQACEQERFWIASLQATNPEFGYNGYAGGQCPVGPHLEALRWVNAHPLLRSDGRPFISARSAARFMGFTGNMDAVSKAIRRGGVCCGFVFQRISVEDYLRVHAKFLTLPTYQDSEPTPTRQKGYHLTAETRGKLSRLHRDQPHSETHRRNRLIAISKPIRRSDGQVFPSLFEAGKALGLSQGSIYQAIRKGTPRKGFTFVKEVLL